MFTPKTFSLHCRKHSTGCSADSADAQVACFLTQFPKIFHAKKPAQWQACKPTETIQLQSINSNSFHLLLFRNTWKLILPITAALVNHSTHVHLQSTHKGIKAGCPKYSLRVAQVSQLKIQTASVIYHRMLRVARDL